MSEEYLEIEQRTGVCIPESYRALLAAGAFEPTGASALRLSDVRWLTPTAIRKWRHLEFMVDGLVPFAKSARRDLYCWYTPLIVAPMAPVVFCPGDHADGKIFAPSFIGALYRLAVEECAGSWFRPADLEPGESLRDLYVQNARVLTPHLPSSWATELNELSARPIRTSEKGTGVCSFEEADLLVRRLLAYPRLDESIVVHRGQ